MFSVFFCYIILKLVSVCYLDWFTSKNELKRFFICNPSVYSRLQLALFGLVYQLVDTCLVLDNWKRIFF